MLWAKLYTDILGDPKLMRAARKGAKQLELLPWLIVFAKQCDDNGRLSVNGEPAEAEDIAALLPGVRASRVAEAFASLLACGVLTTDGDGVLRLTAWDHRSGGKPSDRPESVGARVKRHREAKRNAQTVTPCNALHETPCNDIEQEQEREQEKEGEKKRTAAGAAGDRALFEEAMAMYPRRSGSNPRRDAEQAWSARIREGAVAGVMLAGVQRYAAWCEAEKQVGTRFVMRGATFFGPARHFEESWEASSVPEGKEHPDEMRYRVIAEEQRRKAADDEAWIVGRMQERGILPKAAA